MNKTSLIIAAFTLVGVILSSPMTKASETDVIDVKIAKSSSGYRFDVTLSHADTGWDHYAKVWEVVGPDGNVVGTRVLAHPHVNEQPFTRSLGGVEISDGVKQVTVRAVDNLGVTGGATLKVDLPE